MLIWGDFGWAFFLPIQSVCLVGEPLCGVSRNPLLISNKIIQGHLLNIKLLVADIPAVGSPYIADHAILEVILAGRCFGQFRPYL